MKLTKQLVTTATASLRKRKKIRQAIAILLFRLAAIILGCEFEWSQSYQSLPDDGEVRP